VSQSTSKRISSANASVDPATQGPISTKPLVSQRTRRATTIVGVVVTVVVLALLAALVYLMYTSYDRAAAIGVVPGTVRLRDIAFVVMALETLVLVVLAIIVIVLLMVLVVLIYDRVIPILEQLNKTVNTVTETVHTVRGTTAFVGEKIVTPFIEVSSYAAGIARICKGILDLVPRRKKRVAEPDLSVPEE
jgi:hypothetical protein